MKTPEPTPVPGVRKMTFPGLSFPDTEAHLGDPRGIGIVDDEDRALEGPGEPIDDGKVDPGLVDVARELERAIEGHTGEADPDGGRLAEAPAT